VEYVRQPQVASLQPQVASLPTRVALYAASHLSRAPISPGTASACPWQLIPPVRHGIRTMIGFESVPAFYVIHLPLAG